MTDFYKMSEVELKEQAAMVIEDLAHKLDERDSEIRRTYELLAVLHPLALTYLESDPKPINEDGERALETLKDAVYAIENNLTLDQAELGRSEEEGANE